jgi:hypothetical protein
MKQSAFLAKREACREKSKLFLPLKEGGDKVSTPDILSPPSLRHAQSFCTGVTLTWTLQQGD